MNKIKVAKKLIALADELLTKKIKKIIYIAGVVKSDTKLQQLVESKYPNIYCHHMTIKYGDINELPDFIGKEIKFHADAIYKDEKAIAITGIASDSKVRNFMKTNKQNPHITICTANGVKPVYSNELILSKNKEDIEVNNLEILDKDCILTDYTTIKDLVISKFNENEILYFFLIIYFIPQKPLHS